MYEKRYEPTDPRLGRHVRHDPRSRNYAVVVAGTVASKRWHSSTPVLDQGNLGSCTGNAAVKSLSYEPFSGTLTQVLDENLAVSVYSQATKEDSYPGQYPPTDTGSDGLSVAKVCQERGFISGYTHAFSFSAVLTALQSGPVIVGTEWRQDMFNPASDGKVSITGNVAGGHEYVLDEVDVETSRVWMQNSWGSSWGRAGRAYFTFDDFTKLLGADGDVTVFVANTQPPPTPADPDAALASAAHEWLKVKHRTKNNVAFEKAVNAWLAGRKS